MQLNSMGIAGEVRCVITKTDGSIKTDTGYQKNLILNQGLDFFGGDKGRVFNTSCVIGSGNSTPIATQTKLDAFIAITNGTDTTSDYSYTDAGDGLYKMWQQKKYRFAGLGNVNINEIGLASTGTTSSNYYLTTRVLTKDSLGAPASLSLKTGEVLDVYYKLHKIIDTTDKSFVINVLDGDGGAVPYNVVIRPIAVGTDAWEFVSESISTATETHYSTNDLSAITSKPSSLNSGINTLSNYVPESLERNLNLQFDLNQANAAIRTVTFDAYSTRTFKFLPFQMRIGRVLDDAPLTKTNKETLTIPLKISWGRYEGEL